MKIVFASNFINHHQVPLADSLAALPGVEYYFIASQPIPESFIKSGYPDYSDRPYLIKAYRDAGEMAKARELIDNADVMIGGSIPEQWYTVRLKSNKVTFHYSERWFRKDYHSLFSPKAWYNYYRFHTRYRNRRSYMLCASAYTASDVGKIFAYPGKCFKWGYFTHVESLDIENIIGSKSKDRIKILFVARFIPLKHPELPVLVADRLRKDGLDFEINMYGSGDRVGYIEQMIREFGLENHVRLHGNRKNDEILEIMKEHHIFLFTSDRNEGWGAVVNEAMGSGCAVIASQAIGSVPFLIENGKTGLIFKDQDIDSLYEKVVYLIRNSSIREDITRNAYNSVSQIWSPENAAKSFLRLAESALEGNLQPAEFGPCSLANS